MVNVNNRIGQITAFVIVAIVIVALIGVFFVFRGSLFRDSIPAEFAPIYTLYDSCIEQETRNALDILGSQGGRIDIGEFVPPSDYAPFSSHLNFIGISIPYWYYVSGNNLITENIPTRLDMERDVEDFLEDRVNDCDFSGFYSQGFYIETNDPKVDVEIKEERVFVEVRSALVSQREDKSARRSTHKKEIQSKIGKYYDLAIDIYNKEKDDLFLENYAIDVLYNYVPVDGVEVQCSPKIWKTPEVVKDLKEGLQANIAAVKLEGSYYRLNDEDDDYFVRDLDVSVDEPVNFIYLAENFPSKIEVSPASQTLMVAEPVGTQEGLGILGFCYVPYHFVYDVSFPVLVQISDGQEVFQYPLSVIIDNNFPREAELSDLIDFEEEEVDICSFPEGEVTVKTYDVNLNPVEAEVSYNCFSSVCEIGRTESLGIDAVLEGKIPRCVNGYLIADAEGYAEEKILFSSNSQDFAEIFLEREYEVEIELRVAGRPVGFSTGEEGSAVVHFTGDDYSSSAILPEVDTAKLKEGLYDVAVYVYGASDVEIPATRKTECFEVSQGGILGFFGGTSEECVDVEIPAFNVDYALTGGGKTTEFILETDLENGKIVIDVSELPEPNSLEQLQYNYEIFDTLGVQFDFT
jgi:hypothetical protein